MAEAEHYLRLNVLPLPPVDEPATGGDWEAPRTPPTQHWTEQEPEQEPEQEQLLQRRRFKVVRETTLREAVSSFSKVVGTLDAGEVVDATETQQRPEQKSLRVNFGPRGWASVSTPAGVTNLEEVSAPKESAARTAAIGAKIPGFDSTTMVITVPESVKSGETISVNVPGGQGMYTTNLPLLVMCRCFLTDSLRLQCLLSLCLRALKKTGGR